VVTVHSENMTIYILGMNGYQEEDRMATKGTKDTESKELILRIMCFLWPDFHISYEIWKPAGYSS
jgi:hypothetical protein